MSISESFGLKSVRQIQVAMQFLNAAAMLALSFQLSLYLGPSDQELVIKPCDMLTLISVHGCCHEICINLYWRISKRDI